MAVIGTTALTYMDWAKRLDPSGKTATIVELLSQTNAVLDDMLVVEGNLTTGHKTTVRTGIPSGTWRLLNYGVDLGKSTTAPIVDTCGNLEAESQVDIDIAKLNGNTAEFRMSESTAYLQGLGQQMATTLFYGNVGLNPERFHGFAPRYNSLTGSNSSANVISAGAAGTNETTSIWVVTWGPNTVHGIFPKGKMAGLEHTDKGEHRVYDTQTVPKPYWAYVDHYKWELGLTVRDWRYVVRICNIDVSDLQTVNAANMINLLTRAVYRLPTTGGGAAPITDSDGRGISGSMGRTVIYCNRVVATYLDLQASNKSNVQLTSGEWGGAPITMFRGIPIKVCDAIINTEAGLT